MKQVVLRTADGIDLPVSVAESGPKRLVECREAATFLRHISGNRCDPELSPDTFLRGVVIPGEGAFFQLRDVFGVVADDVCRLTDSEVRETLSGILW